MSTTQNLKFIHLSTGSASAHKADTGAIIFEKATGRIAVAAGADTDVEYYGGGRVSNAKFENSILTISFNDTAETIKLDFSDVASTSGVHAVLQPLANRVKDLEATVNGDGTDGSGLVKKVAANATAIQANTAAIDAINNPTTGILAEAKKYTNGKVGEIGTDVTVKKYVDDAKGAAIEAAKTYADATFDTKGSAATAQTAATEAAKNYTDGKVSEINATTAKLRIDLGEKTAAAGTDTAFGRIKALETTVSDPATGLVKKVNDNATAITALQGLHADNGASGKKTVAEEVTAGVNEKVGSIGGKTVSAYVDDAKADAIATAKSYTDTEIGKVNTDAKALGNRVTTLETKVGSSDDGADAGGSVYARIAKNKADIATLVGEDAGKSVRTISTEEVAKVVAGAPASYDTLKEIADWIANDTTGAAKMANDISNLKTTVGKEAEGDSPATGLVKKVADNTTNISANASAITALQGLHVSGKTVAQEVTDGIAAIPEASDFDGTDVKVTVKTAAGSVSDVIVDASGLRNDLGVKTADAGTDTAFARIKALETTVGDSNSGLVKAVATNTSNINANADAIKALQDAQASGSLMWSVWN